MIRLETKYTKRIVTEKIIASIYQPRVNRILKRIKNKTADGVEMTGWLDYCNHYDKKLLNSMVDKAKQWWSKKIKKVVVIGIGGSYLGIKAGLDMLKSEFDRENLSVYFAHNFNQNYVLDLVKRMKNDPFGIIVISKSGVTLEPAVILDIFYKKLVKNVGEEKANELVVAITDSTKGILSHEANKKKWTKFPIPNNIGGRFSALTPTGMFLFILLKLDYKQIIKGASVASKRLMNPKISRNDAFKYACYRNYFRTIHRYSVENFIVYDPGLCWVGEVWKQLFGESEGKNFKSLYPATSLFTTDLHSMGQFLQDGTRNFFETTLYVKKPIEDIKLNLNKKEWDFIKGKTLSYLNDVAMLSTVKAHYEDGKTKNLIIYVDKQDAFHFGYLYVWLCFAAMCSAYLLKLNPFDQPGVENYKKRIKETLHNKSYKLKW